MTTKQIKYFPGLIIFFLLAACHTLPAQLLPALQFSNAIDTAQHALIIDVRTPPEYSAGHIRNAVNIDWKNDQFKTKTDRIDKRKPLYIYCQSGVRSAKAAAVLRAQGFEVYELQGGILKWRANGLPEVLPDDSRSSDKQPAGMNIADYARMLKFYPNILFDFYANWCLSCTLMEPHLVRISQKENIKLVRIDVDKNPQLVTDLNIASLPALHFYKHGDLQWGYVGYLGKRALQKKLKD